MVTVVVADRIRPCFDRVLVGAGLDSLERLSSRSLGTPVADHRTSWVRRLDLAPYTVYIKTYDYGYRGGLRRGLLRTTFLVPGRAAREWDALKWLQDNGFGGPAPLAALADRRFGCLRRSVLITEADPGLPADRLLPTLPAAERDALLAAIERFVLRLHATGFRDRNLDLRNLLAERRADDDWRVAKIDSPRHRLLSAGPADDRLARADWDRLAASIARLHLPR